jgi:hypothetical protein
MSVILVVSIGASSLLGGCCCPTDRQVVRSPAVAVQVVDDESGEPVEGARVQLCRVRIGPPPDAVVDRWNKTTDSDGRVSFAYRATEETVMPLMMHGVPQRGWILCAEHPDHGYARGPSRGHLLVERGSTEVTPREVPDQTIELAPRGDETRPCDCDALPDETDGWE